MLTGFPRRPARRYLFSLLQGGAQMCIRDSCRELGYGAEYSKERAKAHFAAASFNDLTIDQLDWLIDRLEQQQARRGSAQQQGSHDRDNRETSPTTRTPPEALRE